MGTSRVTRTSLLRTPSRWAAATMAGAALRRNDITRHTSGMTSRAIRFAAPIGAAPGGQEVVVDPMKLNADLLAFVRNAFPDMWVTVEPWVKDRSAWRSRSSIRLSRRFIRCTPADCAAACLPCAGRRYSLGRCEDLHDLSGAGCRDCLHAQARSRG